MDVHLIASAVVVGCNACLSFWKCLWWAMAFSGQKQLVLACMACHEVLNQDAEAEAIACWGSMSAPPPPVPQSGLSSATAPRCSSCRRSRRLPQSPPPGSGPPGAPPATKCVLRHSPPPLPIQSNKFSGGRQPRESAKFRHTHNDPKSTARPQTLFSVRFRLIITPKSNCFAECSFF